MAETCDSCEEASAVVRASVTTLDGEVMETAALCADCARSGISFLVPSGSPWLGRWGQIEEEADGRKG